MSVEPTLAQRIQQVEAWVKNRDTIKDSTVKSLATQFKLSAKEVRVIIDRARYKLAANAEAYVDAHRESVELGLEIGRAGGRDATSGLKVAQEGAAWALERIGQGHARVLDAPKAQGATGPQIVIGIQVGGVTAKNTVSEEDVIEAETDVIVTPSISKDIGSDVTITQEALAEPAPTAKVMPTQPKVPKVKKSSGKQREVEKKVQAILAAVTEANAQLMMRSIIDLGYEAGFAWEMVKAMLEIEGK